MTNYYNKLLEENAHLRSRYRDVLFCMTELVDGLSHITYGLQYIEAIKEKLEKYSDEKWDEEGHK